MRPRQRSRERWGGWLTKLVICRFTYIPATCTFPRPAQPELLCPIAEALRVYGVEGVKGENEENHRIPRFVESSSFQVDRIA